MSRVAITGLLLNNVDDFGAKGDGVTDDRAAIQRAIDDAVLTGIDGIFIPPRTYSLGLLVAQQNSLRFTGATNFHIVGAGPRSTLRFAGIDAGGTNWAMLRFVTGCSKIYIDDLTLDGNRANVTNSSLLTRLIFTDTDPTDFDINRVIFTSSPRFGATIDGTRMALRNCRFTDNFDNALELRNIVETGLVQGSFFWANVSDDDIAVRPTAAIVASREITIDTCDVDKNGTGRAVLVVGDAASLGPIGIKFCDCNLRGRVLIDEASRVSVNDCLVFSSNGDALEADRTANFVLFNGNVVECTDAAASAMACLTAGGNTPQNVKMSENLIIAARRGIECDGGTYVTLNDNLIRATGLVATTALACRSIGGNSNLQVRDNDCVGPWTDACLGLSASPGSFDEILITNNRMETTNAFAISFAVAGGVYNNTPEMSGNYVDTSQLIAAGDIALLPEDCYIAGGGGGRGLGGTTRGGTQYVGNGSPAGLVTGSRGDTFQRVDGGAGTTFYIKETGDLTTTGWRPLGAGAILAFGDNSVAAGADTRFMDQWNDQGSTASTTETTPIVAPRAGVLRNMFVRHAAAVGNGNSIVYTVRINGANSTLTVTLATGAIAQASDLVNTVTVAQGDRITLQAVKAVAIGNGAVIPSVTMEFVG